MTPNKKVGWVPILGDFDIDGSGIVFHGGRTLAPPPNSPPGTEPQEHVLHGILLSSQTIADGDISADVQFQLLTESSVFELMVAYDAGAEHIVCAGVGGDRTAFFAVREFGAPKSGEWYYHHAGGGRSAFRAGTKYHVEANFRGDSVALSIDGVRVGLARVTSPGGRPRQVGLLCKSEQDVSISNFTVKAQKPRVFIVMQFGDQYDDVYTDVVKEVCDSYEISSLRGDDVVGPGLIIADIIREISASQLIIADITPSNPNVYFEVGYALALRKPTILLAKKGTPLPFDVAGFRVLFYEDSIGGKGKLEKGLRRHLEAILERDGSSA